jgi:hypothetical protein
MPADDLNSGGRDRAPFIHRLRAKLAECVPGDQMTLDVEAVVDGGVS